MTMATLSGTDLPPTIDLARQFAVSPTVAFGRAERYMNAEGSFVQANGALGAPTFAQASEDESIPPKAVMGELPMDAMGHQTERAGLPKDLADLAASVLHHLQEVQARNRELTQQLTETMEAHRRDAVELIAAETREMATKEDLERALTYIARLQTQLAYFRRSWWRRLW